MAYHERAEKISKYLDNCSTVTNRDLIYLLEPEQRKELGLSDIEVEEFEELEAAISAIMQRLQRFAQKQWHIPELDVSVMLNLRDSRSGRSNASNQRKAKWRSQHETKKRKDGDCINLNSIWGRMNSGSFYEYAHIAKDPQIGSFETADKQSYIEILLAHEYAHILEKYVTEEEGFPFHLPRKCKGHGYNWQTIYRKLRLHLGHVKIKSRSRKKIEEYLEEVAPKCGYCEKPMLRQRAKAKYCSPKCRVYGNRKANQ